MKIAVVDYGMGNLRSVSKALEHVAPQASVLVTADPEAIAGAERVVVPGQGAMPDCMRELGARGLIDAVKQAAAAKPFLGICIGLQMLFERSEEGNVRGLGVLAGAVRRFPEPLVDRATGARLKVPHMGWNEVRQTRPHALWRDIPEATRFYFVHSYYADESDAGARCGQTEYGVAFTCAVARDNMFAVQFHPEKSQAAGLTLLRNFVTWRP
ncbi:MAG TPA: imidazole glycerol phosphate synthase subunit HisH [Steroidobacteraceae bacterium]|nr:imidazole glycerol phosphate synthase subunit HisH [Steroidobacteraceae bacterium]